MADPDPISEQLATAILARLATVKVANGYSGDLIPIRATHSKVDIDPKDLVTVLWCDDPAPIDAPWGQLGWRQNFEVATYLRESESSEVPIDRRINVAAADVQRALMSDPRFGGLCYIDASIAGVHSEDGMKLGLASVRNYLQCEYRVLRSDPRRLAPAAINQSIFQGGGVLLLAPYTGARTLGPWRRYDNLQITPSSEPQTDQNSDDREGLSRVVDEQVTGYRQRYEIESDWLNPQVLAWQLGGESVDTFSQTATPRVGIPHLVPAVDSVVPLHDADGEAIFNVASIQAVTNAAGTTTYTAGTDCLADVDALREGLLKIPPGSTIVPGSVVLVSFTPSALTSRPAINAAMACSYRVRARVSWRAADGQVLVHGDFDGSLVARATTRSPDAPSTSKLILTVLDDGSDRPAGRLLIPTGPVPAAGY